MEDGKGARKSDNITATPIRKMLPTRGKQQSECEQELPKKPRSAMKKDLTAFFGEGKRSPGPTTAGNPIETVIQHRELQVGTPTGKGDSGAGAGGKKDDNNSWRTPLIKKKRDKSNLTPQDPAACILPNGKDKRLGPIKSKSDLPKYQLTMRNYFNIPNQMAFSNVNQDNGRVIKGSAIMGFSTIPKNYLDDAAEDLRTMGCSLF